MTGPGESGEADDSRVESALRPLLTRCDWSQESPVDDEERYLAVARRA